MHETDLELERLYNASPKIGITLIAPCKGEPDVCREAVRDRSNSYILKFDNEVGDVAAGDLLDDDEGLWHISNISTRYIGSVLKYLILQVGAQHA